MNLPSFINLSSKSEAEQKDAILQILKASDGVGVDSATLRHQTSLQSSVLYRLIDRLIAERTIAMNKSGYVLA